MTLHITSNFEIPSETKQIAHAAFPKGNMYMTLRDELGSIFNDEIFKDVYSNVGQGAIPPWRLALVTVLQHGENLSDRQAANAVRGRIDWKYLLGLEITDPGFDYSVLCEFRKRLLSNSSENLILDTLLDKCIDLKIIKKGGQQRTDSTHVLASVREMNRYEIVGETMRAALNQLSDVAPEFVKDIAKADWYDRYARRIENFRLPRATSDKKDFATQVGKDIHHLLTQINKNIQLKYLSKFAALITCFNRHFKVDPETSEIIFRSSREVTESEFKIESPYDIDARFRTKRDTSWSGYMVHLTETCDDLSANIITNVRTTPANVHDIHSTAIIHKSLKKKNLEPAKHLVDSAYLSIKLIAEYGNGSNIEMIGHPRSGGISWREKLDDGYTLDKFIIKWDQQKVICPENKLSISWGKHNRKDGNDDVRVSYSKWNCKNCPTKERCITEKQQRRQLTFPSKKAFDARELLRNKMETKEYQLTYQKRSGIEGTISQSTRVTGSRRSKYSSLVKTHLQQVASAAAINLYRLADWFNDKPISKTRESKFYKLRPKAA
jgi:transposase